MVGGDDVIERPAEIAVVDARPHGDFGEEQFHHAELARHQGDGREEGAGVALPKAVREVLGLSQRLAQLDGSLEAEVQVQDHVDEARRKPQQREETMDPLVVERVEVLEVVD